MQDINLPVISFLNELQLICLHTSIAISVKWFQLLQSNTYNTSTYSFICTQLNGSKYCYVSQTIQSNISHLFTHFNHTS